MNQLSEKQRIEILIFLGHGDRKRTYEQVCEIFNERYQDRNPISKTTVCRVVKHFEQTGNVKNSPKSGRPSTTTCGDKALDILLSIEENPKQSTRKLADEFDVSKQSVGNLLRKTKFHPYRIQSTQELSDDDFDRRAQFCEVMQERCNEDDTFSSRILFTDEATFYLNGSVHRHNCRFWSTANPHWVQTVHTQHPEKLNVWLGTIGHHIIGPFL